MVSRSGWPLAAALLLGVGRGAAQTAGTVGAAVDRVTPAMIEIRHRLHQNPELGNREVQTAALVAERLRTLGLEVRTGIAHTGVVAVLRGRRPGPVVAVRADMDALPVTEDTPLPWKSTVRTTYLGQQVGVAHACGHDVHTAVQLGVAEVLAGMRDRLPGTVLFIFQPAEEGPPPGERGGAELMLAEGAFRDPAPSAVFGLHTMAELDVGTIGFTVGPALASAASWSATIIGRQSHGAMPHQSVDPVVMASQVVTALQTIRARSLSPFTPSVVTVGVIRGGERQNIIPGEVTLMGTIRGYSAAVMDTIRRRMDAIMDGITRAGAGSYRLVVDSALPVVVNDTGLAQRMLPVLRRAAGPGNLRMLEPASVAEDFSYFANAVPGFYYRLGTSPPGARSGPHHSPTFLADDAAVPIGIRTMTELLLAYLER
jgi:amidohydrolase